MQSISHLPSPVLAGVVRESDSNAAIAGIKNCHLRGAGMIDLHLSCLQDTSEANLRRIIAASKLPVLSLHYDRTCDWQVVGHTEEQRTELMLRSVLCGASGVDMQGYTFDPASKDGYRGARSFSFSHLNPKEVVSDEKIIDQQRRFMDKVRAQGAEVLLSCHPGVVLSAEQVVELALFLEERQPDVIKIVSAAPTEEDAMEALRAMKLLKKHVKTPVSYHANGACGGMTRVLCPALGGHIAFCVDGYTASSTMEQIDLATTKTAIDSLKLLV